MPTLSLDHEKRILKRLQSGDRAAFRELYDAFADRLYRAVIFPRLGIPDVAEDIMRDTFLTAFEKIGTVKWQERSLYYWLSRIAYNKVVDFHRANRRADTFVQGFTAYLDVHAPKPEGPEDAFLREETAQTVTSLVHSLVDQLNDRYRRAVELRFFDGLEREACAEAMDVTVGNFDVILFRAIKRLKTLHSRQDNG